MHKVSSLYNIFSLRKLTIEDAIIFCIVRLNLFCCIKLIQSIDNALLISEFSHTATMFKVIVLSCVLTLVISDYSGQQYANTDSGVVKG